MENDYMGNEKVYAMKIIEMKGMSEEERQWNFKEASLVTKLNDK